MGELAKQFGPKLSQWWAKTDKKTRMIIFVGLLGVILLLLSGLFSNDDKATVDRSAQTVDLSLEEYGRNLEKQLTDLIQQIQGVGKAQVFISFENSQEYVYATEEKHTYDTSEDYSGEDQQRQISDSTQTNYLLVDGQDGKQALLTTQRQPTVQGVVVVCEGADQVFIQERVFGAVTTALNLPSNRVFVTKMKE